MEDRTNVPSKMLLILDMDNIRGTDVSNIPKVLVPLYVEEMELHAEEVFQVKFRDEWEIDY
jgi:hypothetical protein